MPANPLEVSYERLCELGFVIDPATGYVYRQGRIVYAVHHRIDGANMRLTRIAFQLLFQRTLTQLEQVFARDGNPYNTHPDNLVLHDKRDRKFPRPNQPIAFSVPGASTAYGTLPQPAPPAPKRFSTPEEAFQPPELFIGRHHSDAHTEAQNLCHLISVRRDQLDPDIPLLDHAFPFWVWHIAGFMHRDETKLAFDCRNDEPRFAFYSDLSWVRLIDTYEMAAEQPAQAQTPEEFHAYIHVHFAQPNRKLYREARLPVPPAE